MRIVKKYTHDFISETMFGLPPRSPTRQWGEASTPPPPRHPHSPLSIPQGTTSQQEQMTNDERDHFVEFVCAGDIRGAVHAAYARALKNATGSRHAFDEFCGLFRGHYKDPTSEDVFPSVVPLYWLAAYHGQDDMMKFVVALQVFESKRQESIRNHWHRRDSLGSIIKMVGASDDLNKYLYLLPWPLRLKLTHCNQQLIHRQSTILELANFAMRFFEPHRLLGKEARGTMRTWKRHANKQHSVLPRRPGKMLSRPITASKFLARRPTKIHVFRNANSPSHQESDDSSHTCANTLSPWDSPWDSDAASDSAISLPQPRVAPNVTQLPAMVGDEMDLGDIELVRQAIG